MAPEPQTEMPVSGSLGHLSVADFDQDGSDDLVYEEFDREDIPYFFVQKFRLLRGGPDGLWTTPWAEIDNSPIPDARSTTRDETLEDVDGDGYPELALAFNGTAADVTEIWSSGGTEELLRTDVVEGGESRPVGVDADGDGMGDLIVGTDPYNEVNGEEVQTGALRLYLGSATDGLVWDTDTPPPFEGSPTWGAYNAPGGDLDGDGLAEVLSKVCYSYYPSYYGTDFVVYGAGLEGRTEEVVGYSAECRTLECVTQGTDFVGVDVDGDGYDDLVSKSSSCSEVTDGTSVLRWWLGSVDGIGDLAEPSIPIGSSFDLTPVPDLDDDGDGEVLVRRALPFQADLYRGSPEGLDPVATTLVPPPEDPGCASQDDAIGDFDGNGIPDLALSLVMPYGVVPAEQLVVIPDLLRP